MTGKERKLGRGLESLISSLPEGSPAHDRYGLKEAQVQPIPMAAIDPNPFQPRKSFDLEDLNELVESLRMHGLLQPIVVRPSGARFQLIAGERRWRAAIELGWSHIEAYLVTADDQRMQEWALIENIHRQDLGPMELAHGYKRLLTTADLTQEELAKRLGQSRSSVTNILRLLELPDSIKEKVSRGTVSMGAARALLGIEDLREQEEAAARTEAGQMTVRQIEHLAASKRRRAPRGGRRRDPNLTALEEDFQRQLGTKVGLQGSFKRGRLVIEYYSQAQLHQIVRRVRGTEEGQDASVGEAEAAATDFRI